MFSHFFSHFIIIIIIIGTNITKANGTKDIYIYLYFCWYRYSYDLVYIDILHFVVWYLYLHIISHDVVV